MEQPTERDRDFYNLGYEAGKKDKGDDMPMSGDKHCPFCGSWDVHAASESTTADIECLTCGAKFWWPNINVYGPNRVWEIRKRWNQRKAPKQD